MNEESKEEDGEGSWARAGVWGWRGHRHTHAFGSVAPAIRRRQCERSGRPRNGSSASPCSSGQRIPWCVRAGAAPKAAHAGSRASAAVGRPGVRSESVAAGGRRKPGPKLSVEPNLQRLKQLVLALVRQRRHVRWLLAVRGIVSAARPALVTRRLIVRVPIRLLRRIRRVTVVLLAVLRRVGVPVARERGDAQGVGAAKVPESC